MVGSLVIHHLGSGAGPCSAAARLGGAWAGLVLARGPSGVVAQSGPVHMLPAHAEGSCRQHSLFSVCLKYF